MEYIQQIHGWKKKGVLFMLPSTKEHKNAVSPIKIVSHSSAEAPSCLRCLISSGDILALSGTEGL